MTRAQSVDVVNDSTTLQSRIDTVLAAPVMEWDHSPEIGWQPGDPLYDYPNPLMGGQYVRPLFQLIDTDSYYARCTACEADWSGPEACWLCGDPDTARTVRQFPGTVVLDEAWVFPTGPDDFAAIEVRMIEWQRRWEEASRTAMQPMIEQVNRLARLMAVSSPRYHFTIDQQGVLERHLFSACDTEPQPDPDLWRRANTQVRVLPAVADVAAPTVAELAAAEPVPGVQSWSLGPIEEEAPEPFIRVPAGVEFTSVQSLADLPGASTEYRRYYFDRPATESRRPRETR